MTSFTCECGERVEMYEVTNAQHDMGMNEDAEAVYFATCYCSRQYLLLQYPIPNNDDCF